MTYNAILASLALLGITISGCGVEPTDTAPGDSMGQALTVNAKEKAPDVEDEAALTAEAYQGTQICTTACWTRCSGVPSGH